MDDRQIAGPEGTKAEQRIQELEERLAELERQQRQEQERRQAAIEWEQQRQKKERRWIILICAIAVPLLAALVVGLFCYVWNMDKESPATAEALLQAMLAQDAEAGYELLYPGWISPEEFEEIYDGMYEFWLAHGGQSTFTLRRVSISVNTNPAESRYETDFVVRSGEAKFSLNLVRIVRGESAGVVSFQLS